MEPGGDWENISDDLHSTYCLRNVATPKVIVQETSIDHRTVTTDQQRHYCPLDQLDELELVSNEV